MWHCVQSHVLNRLHCVALCVLKCVFLELFDTVRCATWYLWIFFLKHRYVTLLYTVILQLTITICKCHLSPHVAYVFRNENESYTSYNFFYIWIYIYIHIYIHVEWHRANFTTFVKFGLLTMVRPSQLFSGVENKSVCRMAGIDFIYIRRLIENWYSYHVNT